jgi:peptide/nickel transport system substrate-binding protein
MRVDVPPFTDNRVRQALKLIAGRPKLVEVALDGFGAVGNDVLAGRTLEFFNPHLPQRHQDIEQAKSLLKAAGQTDLKLILETAPIQNVTIPAATAYAQQASAANVSIKVRQHQTGPYFNPSELFLKMPFAQDYWGIISLDAFWGEALIPGAAYNETHWNDPETNQLYNQAKATTNKAEAQALWNRLQEIQYDHGGYIVWAQQQTTDGATHNVRGVGTPGWGGINLVDTWNWGLA